MKKFISALLAAVAVTALSCVFVSAKETNVALHKPWSGIEVPTNEGANVYTGDFTDGVYAAEGDEFSYKEPWFYVLYQRPERRVLDQPHRPRR